MVWYLTYHLHQFRSVSNGYGVQPLFLKEGVREPHNYQQHPKPWQYVADGLTPNSKIAYCEATRVILLIISCRPMSLQMTGICMKPMKERMSSKYTLCVFKHIKNRHLSSKHTFVFVTSASLKSETERYVLAYQDGIMNTLVYRHLISIR